MLRSSQRIQRCSGDQHRREHAPQVVERAHVQRGEAGQRDEVRALPEAVHVGLAQPDAAAQQRPVEARRAHLARVTRNGRSGRACRRTSSALARPRRSSARRRGSCASRRSTIDAGEAVHASASCSWMREVAALRAASAAGRGRRSARGSARSGRVAQQQRAAQGACAVSSRRDERVAHERVAARPRSSHARARASRRSPLAVAAVDSMCTSSCSPGSVRRQS